MRVVDEGRRYRRRAKLAVEIKRVTTFVNAPAVVGAALDEESLLPQVLAVLADPDVASGLVDVNSPGVAEAVGVGFRPSARSLQEWVVGRNGIGLARCGVVN